MTEAGIGNAPPSARLAWLLALGIPSLLLGGAYLSEYGFGLYPCEMCWWQRYPHFAAIGFALIASFAKPQRVWIALAGAAIIVSGLIGGFHAGVEYDWWEGITGCASTGTREAGVSAMDAITNTPLIRCDQAPFHFLGISLAGWNFLISVIGGISIFALLFRRTER